MKLNMNRAKFPYPASIDDAVDILDYVFPEWYKEIRKNDLDMEAASECILGQIFGDYDAALKILFDIHIDSEFDPSDDFIFGRYTNIEDWMEFINYRLRVGPVSSSVYTPTPSAAGFVDLIPSKSDLSDVLVLLEAASCMNSLGWTNRLNNQALTLLKDILKK